MPNVDFGMFSLGCNFISYLPHISGAKTCVDLVDEEFEEKVTWNDEESFADTSQTENISAPLPDPSSRPYISFTTRAL